MIGASLQIGADLGFRRVEAKGGAGPDLRSVLLASGRSTWAVGFVSLGIMAALWMLARPTRMPWGTGGQRGTVDVFANRVVRSARYTFPELAMRKPDRAYV